MEITLTLSTILTPELFELTSLQWNVENILAGKNNNFLQIVCANLYQHLSTALTMTRSKNYYLPSQLIGHLDRSLGDQ